MIGTIHIMVDGRIEPSDAPIRRAGNIYTLTGNIASEADGIVVERNNIVIDGAGYTIQGTDNPSYTGICLELRTHVIVENINVKNFGCGIWLNHSSNCVIRGNSIENNKGGILISDSSNNSIIGNNIKENKEYGILLEYSSKDNVIYHNNFINNGKQVYLEEESLGIPNAWDNGYPSGGNYWSDYRGVDEKSGPNQDQPRSDGIGDTPYIIDEKNRDRYPLITPYLLRNRFKPVTARTVGLFLCVKDLQQELCQARQTSISTSSWEKMASARASLRIWLRNVFLFLNEK